MFRRKILQEKGIAALRVLFSGSNPHSEERMSEGMAEILKIAGIFMLITCLLSTFATTASNSVCAESVHLLSNTFTGSGSCGPANTSEIIQIQGLSYIHCKCPK